MFSSRMEPKLFILMSKTLSSPAPSLVFPALPTSPPAILAFSHWVSTLSAPSPCPHELPAKHTLPLHAPSPDPTTMKSGRQHVG